MALKTIHVYLSPVIAGYGFCTVSGKNTDRFVALTMETLLELNTLGP